MEISSCTQAQTLKYDLIAIPFWEGKKGTEIATPSDFYSDLLHSPVIMQDFAGKEGEILFVYETGSKTVQRIALVGLGNPKNISVEKLRRVYSLLTRFCHQKKIETLCIVKPQIEGLEKSAVVEGVAEGIFLTNYLFDQLKNKKKAEKSILLKKMGFLDASKAELATVKRCWTIAEGVYLTRDLVNGNADDVNPQYLSSFAQDLAHRLPHVKATILNKKQLEKEKMDLILAVNRGSFNDPALIILSYQGNPSSKDHTVLIGKGITYDTGGLNLKPTVSMETMKADMAGGAAVLGVLYAAASLHLKINLTVMIPATENSIGSKSYKPGDVYKSYHGLTVEVNNPDAEGRLVLADAIAYANKKLKPTRIIDIATLTGGVDIALGSEACGLFSNDDALADALLRSGTHTFERTWRLPLYEEYREVLKSDIADLKNSAGRSASSITAALFLQEFVGDTSWAHLDIASTAYLSDKKRYHPKLGTGFGVRLLIDFLSNKTRT